MAIQHTQKRGSKSTIEALREKVVAINYGTLGGAKPKKINKEQFLHLAHEVGKNPIQDDTIPSRTVPATP